MDECKFCKLEPEAVVHEMGQMVAVVDHHPVTKGHHLIIPRTHRKDYFSLSLEECADLHALLHQLKKKITDLDPDVVGFNIGMNCGEAAGQTIMHAHVHLIPRRKGDIENPTGGIRGAIPENRLYPLS